MSGDCDQLKKSIKILENFIEDRKLLINYKEAYEQQKKINEELNTDNYYLKYVVREFYRNACLTGNKKEVEAKVTLAVGEDIKARWEL